MPVKFLSADTAPNFTGAKAGASVTQRTRKRPLPLGGIQWGHGRIHRNEWLDVKQIMRFYGVRSVLEFGAGLSTELFSLEPIDFVSFDVNLTLVEYLRKNLGAEIYHYCQDDPFPVHEWEGRFDMVFVDGPSERSRELDIANRVANKIIYCHDWGRGQDKVELDPKWRPLWGLEHAPVVRQKMQHVFENAEMR